MNFHLQTRQNSSQISKPFSSLSYERVNPRMIPTTITRLSIFRSRNKILLNCLSISHCCGTLQNAQIYTWEEEKMMMIHCCDNAWLQQKHHEQQQPVNTRDIKWWYTHKIFWVELEFNVLLTASRRPQKSIKILFCLRWHRVKTPFVVVARRSRFEIYVTCARS